MVDFTCNSCQLAFPTSNDQRLHMKTEWHRYNLKRRVAQLAPISEEVFNTKVATAKEDETEEDGQPLTKREQRKRAREELLEKKRQLLELARTRIMSNGGTVKIDDNGRLVVEKKSTEQEETAIKDTIKKDENTLLGDNAGLDDEQVVEKMVQEKIANKVEIPLHTCLFCGQDFPDLDTNGEHMFKKHGLYIPEPKYLVDKEGLIGYLGEKVGYGNVCLVCGYQGRNLQSIRQHMLAKSHCKIPYESEDEKLEIGKFYDFSSSYENGDEDDWEDVSGDEDVSDADEIVAADDTVYASDIGLHLPNGMVAGHRSLVRYWKQNLPPEKELGEGQGTVMAAETRHMVTQFDRQQFREQKRVWAREAKSRDRNDRQNAKFINNKPHFRDELLQ